MKRPQPILQGVRAKARAAAASRIWLALWLPALLFPSRSLAADAATQDPPQVLPAPKASSNPAALPTRVDLRPAFTNWGLSLRSQGARGTCSVFALTGALEYALAKPRQKGTLLSVEFLNWASNQAIRQHADGGFFSDLWTGFAKYGICPETDLPYRPAFDPNLRPDDSVVAHARSNNAAGLQLQLHWIKPWNVATGLTNAEFDEIKRVLAAQWPVCGGLRWPKQERWQERVLEMAPPEGVFDGHSVLLVGYRDDPAQPGGGVFLIRNSGGGESDGAMPYVYARAYMNDAAWIAPPGGM